MKLFTLYEQGGHIYVEEQGALSCATYASVHTCRSYHSESGKCQPTGMHHVDECDIFIPTTIQHGWRDKLTIYEDFCMGSMYGIKIHRSKKQIVAHLRRYDWCRVAEGSTNANLHLSCALVEQAIIEGGFVDG